ncbi:hypothetical protein BB559_001685 [Furculomyces boomerangus]|uniref:Uncharacterized protein n=2 Tax=Harpellales TaxID=61421 RepID=A0A2T9Z178_9FUNG|nr:hypothetical protein BB559_001685 [Furculomyces boomerangus]PVZ97518.1 hypothetical protein BB558_006513 [Smittium angustum]
MKVLIYCCFLSLISAASQPLNNSIQSNVVENTDNFVVNKAPERKNRIADNYDTSNIELLANSNKNLKNPVKKNIFVKRNVNTSTDTTQISPLVPTPVQTVESIEPIITQKIDSASGMLNQPDNPPNDILTHGN